MKLSKETLSYIKNFSGINSGMVFRQGNYLWVKDPSDLMVGHAEIKENFPRDFAIADLNRFLSVLSLFDSPEIEFGDESLLISEGRRKCEYFYSSPATIKTVKNNSKVKIDNFLLQCSLSTEDIDSIVDSCASLGIGTISFIGDGKSASVIVKNNVNTTLGSYELNVESTLLSEYNFDIMLDVSSMKLISSDYDIFVTFTDNMKLINFKSKKYPVEYWISVLSESKVGN